MPQISCSSHLLLLKLLKLLKLLDACDDNSQPTDCLCGFSPYLKKRTQAGQENREAIGYTSLFSSVDKRLVMTKTEGTTGVTGNSGWYTVFQPKPLTAGNQAPKRLRIMVLNLPRERWVRSLCMLLGPWYRLQGPENRLSSLEIQGPKTASETNFKPNQPTPIQIYWTSCWPAGTSFSISRKFLWFSNMDVPALTKVGSRAALAWSTDGNSYFVDGSNCLHLKLTDPGHPWQYNDGWVTGRPAGGGWAREQTGCVRCVRGCKLSESSRSKHVSQSNSGQTLVINPRFEREGMRVEQEVRWYDHYYDVIATGAPMQVAACTTYFCPLPVRFWFGGGDAFTIDTC